MLHPVTEFFTRIKLAIKIGQKMISCRLSSHLKELLLLPGGLRPQLALCAETVHITSKHLINKIIFNPNKRNIHQR